MKKVERNPNIHKIFLTPLFDKMFRIDIEFFSMSGFFINLFLKKLSKKIVGKLFAPPIGHGKVEETKKNN